MWYILIAVLLIISVVVGFSCNGKKTTVQTHDTNTINIDSNTDTIMSIKLNKEKLKQKLTELSKTPAPNDLSLGAKCYKVARKPMRAEYVCAVCGERTFYSDDALEVRVINEELPKCRHLIDQIKFIDIKLDEKQFCNTCSPSVKFPSLCIKVTYKDSENFVCGIDDEDLLLLKEFGEGSDKHHGSYGRETPLKDHIHKIENMLGIKIDK